MIDSHPRLPGIRSALLSTKSPESTEDSDAERRDAAVALILRGGATLDFLLIKRALSERDPWSGQMALPGGRWELSDTGLLHTARRETLEETGLNLEARGTPIGRLPDVITQSAHLPKLRITPYVFAVPDGTEAGVVSTKELDSVYWVPLDVLGRPEVQSEIVIKRSGYQKRFPSYHVVGEHVWGMTYGILAQFRELIG